MAYDKDIGLIKVGNYKIDMKRWIKADSYKVQRTVIDLDAYRDTDGVLHRQALDHVPIKVEFETPPMLTNEDFAELMNAIRHEMSSKLERKITVKCYMPELDDYITQECYMPDIVPQIYGTYGDKIHYDAIRLAFIGY